MDNDNDDGERQLVTLAFAGVVGFFVSTALGVAALAFVWVVLIVTPARRSGALSDGDDDNKGEEDMSWWEVGEIWGRIGVSSKALISVCAIGLVVSMISSMGGVVEPGILGIFSAVFGLLIIVSCLVCCSRCCCGGGRSSSSKRRRHGGGGARHYYYYYDENPKRGAAMVVPPPPPGNGEKKEWEQRSRSAPPQYYSRDGDPEPSAPPMPPSSSKAQQMMMQLHTDPRTFLEAAADRQR